MKQEKLKIYNHVSENSGVGYYRQYLPAVAMRELGIADVRINDFKFGVGEHTPIPQSVLFDQANWADIIIVGRFDNPEFYAQWGAIREFFNVPIVLDTDDNVHHVPPTNPGYQGYHPGASTKQYNAYAIKKVFDAITVTTNGLKDYYGKWHPRIYKLPNAIDMKEWEKYERPAPTDRIKMTFMCSAAHADGFGIILKPVYEILKKYPQVDFYFQDIYWRLLATAPEEVKGQLKNITWIKLEEWAKTMKQSGYDIGLAPLKDNLFNRGKSNLRYLEYAAAGMAPIVSPVLPYAETVRNGENGLIAKEQDEWYTAMEKLIVDPAYREQIAKGAYKEVSDNFDIWKNAGMWDSVYREVVDKYHAFYGEKKRFEPLGKGKYKLLK